MDLEVIKKEKNLIEFKMAGQRHAFPNLLKKALLELKETEFAAYKLKHPLDADAIFVLKTDGTDPEKVLAKAAKSIAGQAKEFEQEVKKALNAD